MQASGGLPGQLQQQLVEARGPHNWGQGLNIDPRLMRYMNNFKKYDPTSWPDLLRFMRNVAHHRDDIPADFINTMVESEGRPSQPEIYR